jgi:hypothetical protein
LATWQVVTSGYGAGKGLVGLVTEPWDSHQVWNLLSLLPIAGIGLSATKGIAAAKVANATHVAAEPTTGGGTGNNNALRGLTETETTVRGSAEQALQGMLEGMSSKLKKEHAVAVGTYDIKTGRVGANVNGDIPENINPQLRARADEIGGIGSKGVSGKNTVGRCAEQRAANDLLNQGSNIGDIRFTDPVRPNRPHIIVEPCPNCKQIFPEAFGGKLADHL